MQAQFPSRKIPPIIYLVTLSTEFLGVTISIYGDIINNTPVINSIINAFFTIQCVINILLYLFKILDSTTGFRIVVYSGLIDLQLQIIFSLITGTVTTDEGQIIGAYIIGIMSIGVITSLGKYIGIFLNALACIDMIIIHLVQYTEWSIVYSTVIPLVFSIVAINSLIYRNYLDKFIAALYGSKEKRPVLRLLDYGITYNESKVILYLLELKTTKEIAKIEGCSESAIQMRLGSIYAKLGVIDRPTLMYKLGAHDVDAYMPN